jgi:hypothetical protein
VAVVRELRLSRIDAAASCAAIAAALADVADVAGEPVAIAPDQSVSIEGAVALTRGVDAESALAVTFPPDALGDVELDAGATDALATASTAGADVLHSDLWLIVGLCCGLMFVYFLLRLVMPRA